MLLMIVETHQHCRAAVALYVQRYPGREIPGSWVFPRLWNRLKRAGRFDVLPEHKCCSTFVCVFFMVESLFVCIPNFILGDSRNLTCPWSMNTRA